MKKKKLFESIPIPRVKSESTRIVLKAQTEKEWLVLDLFQKKAYIGRYVLNTETGEHKSFIADKGKWCSQKLLRIMGFDPMYDSFYTSGVYQKIVWDTENDKNTVKKAMKQKNSGQCALREIDWLEKEFDEARSRIRENNKCRKIDRLMENIKDGDENLKNWIYENFSSGRYLFWNLEAKSYGCSNCGTQIPGKKLGWPKQGESRKCPRCGCEATVKKRKRFIATKIRICKLERPDPEYGVARHYKAEIRYCGSGHCVILDEGVRILLYKKGCEEKTYKIFYNQDGDTYSWYTRITRSNWYTRNPKNKRTDACYLYPEQIKEALEETRYESMGNAFIEMSRKKILLDYNAVMATGCRISGFGVMMEYLIKGRFYRLCQETAQRCYAYNGHYVGCLEVDGKNIEEVMGIKDRQKIYRLREENGGYIRLEWLRYAEKYGCKISEKTMRYMEENRILAEKIEEIPGEIPLKMSADQIANYIQKQVGKGYMTPDKVIDQWTDYLYMCRVQNKSLDNELFYKPKNLKQRHDELVEDSQKLEIVKRMNEDPKLRQQEAAKMEEKFSKASAIMREIKGKYEFTAEGYRIVMPESPVDIVREGYALHHCAGSSERYFNRIENRETFIGFLRRQQEPDIPFYTIEFEPGGTIRQNRSYYDEEPGIEEIRGFLKLWQKEIKSRLTKDDKEHATRSAALRKQNIKELQEKQNSFVLKKLEEDFMEAI